MATVPDTSWSSTANGVVNGNAAAAPGTTTTITAAGSLLSYVTGSRNNADSAQTSSNSKSNSNVATSGMAIINNNNNTNTNSNNRSLDTETWARAGRQFTTSKEIYTRSLFRLCLKFTTSEDEDEGKPEPATAFWTSFSRTSTIGNAGPGTPNPDSICRRMDDSMSGPASGILTRIVDADGEAAAEYALASGSTTGWHIRGDRGDAAVRVGKAKVFTSKQSDAAGREAQILSLDADRWVLCKNASFAAGNSVFTVEDYNEAKCKITVQCSKGPMRGKLIDIHASRCPYVFGRAHEADLCVMDRELSRRHGAILYLPRKGSDGQQAARGNPTKGNFVLVDLESTVCPLCMLLIAIPRRNVFLVYMILALTLSFLFSEWFVHANGGSLQQHGPGFSIDWR